MRFTIFHESRKGQRKINQDRLAYTYSRDTLLLVVADGMGGHAGGEIAAQIAVAKCVSNGGSRSSCMANVAEVKQ